MKQLLLIATILALIEIAAELSGKAHAQNAESSSTDLSALETAVQRSDPFRFLVDPFTWQVLDKHGGAVDEAVNRSTAVSERYLADLAIHDPNRYNALFPLAPEQAVARSNALAAIEQPRYPEQLRGEITDKELLREWDAAAYSITHPTPVTPDLIQQILRNDTSGIWQSLAPKGP